MQKWITFGIWNNNYLFILASIFSSIIGRLIKGYDYHTYSLKFFEEYELPQHMYIHRFLYYFLILICSSLFLLYERKRDKEDNDDTQINQDFQNDELISSTPELIFNDVSYYVNQKISDSFAYLIIFLYVLFQQIEIITNQYFSFGDFWMFELIVMTYLNNKMFKIKIYRHQMLSIYLIAIPFILKTVTIVLLFCDENNYFLDGEINYKYNKTSTQLKSLFVAQYWLFPLSCLSYLIVLSMNSYVIINIKRIIDLKFVSITNILLCYGLFGSILTLLFSLIASFITCGKKNYEVYDIYDYQFNIIDKEGNRFIENIFIYFSSNFWKDLLIHIFGEIASAFSQLFLLKFIQYLTPIHKSFSSPVNFFIEKLILIYQVSDNKSMKYIRESYFLDLASDFSAIIGFLIYLEIIELNFCKLNKNLRKYIIIRSDEDAKNKNNRKESNETRRESTDSRRLSSDTRRGSSDTRRESRNTHKNSINSFLSEEDD